MRWVVPLALLGAMLIGCKPPSETTVLRVSTWGGAGDDGPFEKQLREILRNFEESHPGIKVRYETYPGDEYVQKMLLNHVAGTMPDVMVVDASSAAVFMDNGILADLTPHFASQDPNFLDQYFPNVVETFQRPNGKTQTFAIPNDFTPMVIYYNKDHFDAANLPYPKEGWTFEDFRYAAKKLTANGRYGFTFSNWMPGWVMWLWNNNGDILDRQSQLARGTLDSDANAKTISFLRDLVKVDRSAPSFSDTASMGVDLFASARASMTVSGHWSMVGYKNAPKGTDGKPLLDWKRVGVAPMPTNARQHHTVLYMSGYGIPAKSRNPQLAWDFIKMWTGKQNQTAYNATGIAVCGRKDVAQVRASDPGDPVSAQFLPVIKGGRPPYGSWVEGYAVVETVGRAMMDSVMNNNADPKVALEKAATRIDFEFKKRRRPDIAQAERS